MLPVVKEKQEQMRQYYDAYSPAQIAKLVEESGVRKGYLGLLQTGLLAGAFIAFGAMFYTLLVTGSELGFGVTRLLGGIAFSLGLVLVVVAGAELFTGNNLIVMVWADGKISTLQLAHNWLLVYVANLAGAPGTALLMDWSGILLANDGAVAETAATIGRTKIELDWIEAFLRGILCNSLVCLAVWLSFATHDVCGKILAIVSPISAFVALGFEHSVANMYLIPLAILQGAEGVTLGGFIYNLIPVTLGNIIGGSVSVALVYWVVYLRD